jgi:acetylornithine/succinyldiaminopimelate/putrescine aminotransferase
VSGVGVSNLGHGNKRIREAIHAQVDKHLHTMVYGEFIQEAQDNAAKSLLKLLPAELNCCYFVNSGTEAIEAAIKLVKRVTGRKEVVAFAGSYHGSSTGAMAISANEVKKRNFRPLMPGVSFIRLNNWEDLDFITEKTAGVILETIQGDAGVRIPNELYLLALKKKCEEVGALLVFVEIQCGMGRTGKLFAHQFYDTKPDIVSTAKAIAGGFPLGACLATKNSASGMVFGVHGTTYGGNPLAMAVANAVLEEMLKENFLKNVQEVGGFLKNELIKIQQKFPDLIDEIRGEGLMLGIKINAKIENGIVVKKFIDNHFLTIPAGENVIRILPPLIITKKHVLEAIEKINISFAELK